MGKTQQAVQKIICLPIMGYRYLIKPLLPPCCRFHPSCSQYALDAIRHYGIVRGIQLTSCRLLRCHPWAKGGFDPVSSKKEM